LEKEGMRDIDEIEDDLRDALEELQDQEAEVCHATMNRNDAQSWVNEYTRELEKAKLGSVT
jgi:4-hydroxy-3-methylbut-2-enyl diphosphate reductase IspH